MTARTSGVVVLGVEGHLVTVEVDHHPGLPGMTIVGLPDTAVGEARDRAKAAIINSGGRWPEGRITVALSPASFPKRGSSLDLAIAVGVLASTGDVPAQRAADIVCVGELGLDGRIHPVRGIVVAALTALRAGRRHVAVCPSDARQARLVHDVDVIAVSHLASLITYLRDGAVPDLDESEEALTGRADHGAGDHGTVDHGTVVPDSGVAPPDLADVRGQPLARHAMEIAAAGGHHLAMLGPPGVGKTLLAERLAGLLPDLDDHAALEVTAIHSVAGRLDPHAGLVRRPPFEAPHHTASHAAVIGGGGLTPRTGLVCLAHHGVLFLDEAPEFARPVLDSLRQPLESGQVLVARAGFSVRFPARFQLVLAANPCPCGAPEPVAGVQSMARACRCGPAVRRRYTARLSGPLLDRMDVRLTLQPPGRADLLDDTRPESTATVAPRVAAARVRAARRWSAMPWSLNAHVPGPALRDSWSATTPAMRVLADALDRGGLSARGADRVLRVAWTLADLADVERPGPDQVHAALALRQEGAPWT